MVGALGGARTAHDKQKALESQQLRAQRAVQRARAAAVERLGPLLVVDEVGCVRLSDQEIDAHGLPVVMEGLLSPDLPRRRQEDRSTDAGLDAVQRRKPIPIRAL